jgi:muconolactone delta-isomerase
MLFLLKMETRGAFPLPLEQWMKLVVKHLETLVSYKQQGKILEGGPSADAKGSYFILDVGSIEELQGLVSQLPLFPFGDSELIPLVTLERAMELAKRALAQSQESKK